MLDFYKQIVTAQYEAALCMLAQCVEACPAEHWEGKIANGTFRLIAYHTLFFTDLYLSPNEEAFTLRELHARGGDERSDMLNPGLTKDETLAYVPLCRQKVLESVAAETEQTLRGASGFSWRKKESRGELHIYNIRHIQHHTGQMSAYVRRVHPTVGDKALSWVGSGWR